MSQYEESMRATDDVPAPEPGIRFTVIEPDGKHTEYHGIQRYTGRCGGIAVAEVEDSIEVWDLEYPSSLEVLERYYQDQGEHVPGMRINVWLADYR